MRFCEKISDLFVYFSDVTTQTRQLSTDPKQSLVKGDFHCSTQFSVLDSVHKTVQLANLRQFSHKSMYKSSDNIPDFHSKNVVFSWQTSRDRSLESPAYYYGLKLS